jgi:hypothetical protein
VGERARGSEKLFTKLNYRDKNGERGSTLTSVKKVSLFKEKKSEGGQHKFGKEIEHLLHAAFTKVQVKKTFLEKLLQ